MRAALVALRAAKILAQSSWGGHGQHAEFVLSTSIDLAAIQREAGELRFARLPPIHLDGRQNGIFRPSRLHI